MKERRQRSKQNELQQNWRYLSLKGTMFRVSVSLFLLLWDRKRWGRDSAFYGLVPLLFSFQFNIPKLVTEIYEKYFIVSAIPIVTFLVDLKLSLCTTKNRYSLEYAISYKSFFCSLQFLVNLMSKLSYKLIIHHIELFVLLYVNKSVFSSYFLVNFNIF